MHLKIGTFALSMHNCGTIHENKRVFKDPLTCNLWETAGFS